MACGCWRRGVGRVGIMWWCRRVVWLGLTAIMTGGFDLRRGGFNTEARRHGGKRRGFTAEARRRRGKNLRFEIRNLGREFFLLVIFLLVVLLVGVGVVEGSELGGGGGVGEFAGFD